MVGKYIHVQKYIYVVRKKLLYSYAELMQSKLQNTITHTNVHNAPFYLRITHSKFCTFRNDTREVLHVTHNSLMAFIATRCDNGQGFSKRTGYIYRGYLQKPDEPLVWRGEESDPDGRRAVINTFTPYCWGTYILGYILLPAGSGGPKTGIAVLGFYPPVLNKGSRSLKLESLQKTNIFILKI